MNFGTFNILPPLSARFFTAETAEIAEFFVFILSPLRP